MFLISLIIPIYNAEEYLNNTINSVINQSIGFNNIELILIDDNSNDNSKRIIEKYSKKYSNIIPIYCEKNHGYPGFGRNMGLKKSTADFIMFMDNDDEIDKDFCKKLYETINKENADIVCCDKVRIDSISEIKNNILYTNGTETDDYVIITNDDIPLFQSIHVWNKIFRKKIIDENEIKFLEDTTADDFLFTMEYFLKSKKFVYLKNYFGYRWNQRSDSLSHIINKELIEDLININYKVFDLLKKEEKTNLSNSIFKGSLNHLITESSYLKLNNKEFKNILGKIHDFEIAINFKLKFNETWINIMNYFIMHNNYYIAIYIFRIIDTLRHSKLLRKINRKI